MRCKKCGSKEGFLLMVTDYKPLELLEFNEGELTRYNQKDSGDMEIEIQCAACGSNDLDKDDFDINDYSERPLVGLSDEEWEEKLNEFKPEETAEEDAAEEETAEEDSTDK